MKKSLLLPLALIVVAPVSAEAQEWDGVSAWARTGQAEAWYISFFGLWIPGLLL
jgi:hypothetical protein